MSNLNVKFKKVLEDLEKKQSGQHSICWKTVWQAVRQAMPTAPITGHRT